MKAGKFNIKKYQDTSNKSLIAFYDKDTNPKLAEIRIEKGRLLFEGDVDLAARKLFTMLIGHLEHHINCKSMEAQIEVLKKVEEYLSKFDQPILDKTGGTVHDQVGYVRDLISKLEKENENK